MWINTMWTQGGRRNPSAPSEASVSLAQSSASLLSKDARCSAIYHVLLDPEAALISRQSLVARIDTTGHLTFMASTKGSSRSLWTPLRYRSSGTLLDVPTMTPPMRQNQDNTSARSVALETSSSWTSSNTSSQCRRISRRATTKAIVWL